MVVNSDMDWRALRCYIIPSFELGLARPLSWNMLHNPFLGLARPLSRRLPTIPLLLRLYRLYLYRLLICFLRPCRSLFSRLLFFFLRLYHFYFKCIALASSLLLAIPLSATIASAFAVIFFFLRLYRFYFCCIAFAFAFFSTVFFLYDCIAFASAALALLFPETAPLSLALTLW
jgi:hypothetical protein